MVERIRGIAVPMEFNTTGYPVANTDDRTLHDSIFTILNTTPGERVMRPTFGCWLKLLIFNNLNIVTAVAAEVEIRRSLATWEPRIDVVDVDLEIQSDGVTLIVTVDWVSAGKEASTRLGIAISS